MVLERQAWLMELTRPCSDQPWVQEGEKIGKSSGTLNCERSLGKGLRWGLVVGGRLNLITHNCNHYYFSSAHCVLA